MSFSRIKYDDNAYNLKLERSTGPGDYRLFFGNCENCDKCSSYDGPRNAKSDVSLPEDKSNSQFGPMSEIESYLTNRINKLIDYNEYGKNDEYKNISVVNKKECNEKLIAEDTRFTFPIEAYRCMDLTSYHYIPFIYANSQCEIQDDRIGLNSRIYVKDNYKPSLYVPIDQTLLLPNNNDPLPEYVNMCKNN